MLSFGDGEPDIEIYQSIIGKDVFVIQSTCQSFSKSVADNFMELLALIDTLKRAAAARITAVIPYYGYARQDRRKGPGVKSPITARLAADCITIAGANRVLALTLHAGQIQGFFNIPVDELFPTPIFVPYFKSKFSAGICFVSPDAGGVERARAMAKRLGASLAIIDKRRDQPNQVSNEMNIIGDVKGLITILFDDMVDTGDTLCKAAVALTKKGAKEVRVCCTHPVLSGPAIKNIEGSPLASLIVTDTIPLRPEAAACKKISVVSVAELLAKAIQHINRDESVSSLFA